MGENIAILIFGLLITLMIATGITWILSAIFSIAFSLPFVFAVWTIWIIILYIVNGLKGG